MKGPAERPSPFTRRRSRRRHGAPLRPEPQRAPIRRCSGRPAGEKPDRRPQRIAQRPRGEPSPEPVRELDLSDDRGIERRQILGRDPVFLMRPTPGDLDLISVEKGAEPLETRHEAGAARRDVPVPGDPDRIVLGQDRIEERLFGGPKRKPRPAALLDQVEFFRPHRTPEGARAQVHAPEPAASPWAAQVLGRPRNAARPPPEDPSPPRLGSPQRLRPGAAPSSRLLNQDGHRVNDFLK